MEKPGLGPLLALSYVGVPTLAGVFVLGLLLLVFRDLDADLRARLVPALVVYVLGLPLLALLYFDLDARNCAKTPTGEKVKPQPLWVFIPYQAAHAMWLAVLVGYLWLKHVL